MEGRPLIWRATPAAYGWARSRRSAVVGELNDA